MKLPVVVLSAGAALAALWLISASQGAHTWTPPPGPVPKLDHATFAGGCFWCMETAFEGIPGVYSVTSGYAGGHVKNPTYEQVSGGGTGHAESVQVAYDPKLMSYERLLQVFWRNVDPTDAGGQFCDRGNQYRSAIFYANEQQKREASASKEALESSGRLKKPVVTRLVPLEAFYAAEEPFRGLGTGYRKYLWALGRFQPKRSHP